MSNSSLKNSALKVSVYILSLIIFAKSQDKNINEKSAILPCVQNLHCVNILKCPEVVNTLKAGVLSVHYAAHLRTLFCGWENTRPMICCTKVEEYPAQEDIKTGTGEIITKYSGIDLFPNETICGDSGYNEYKILGGTNTDIYEFPWMALLSIAKGESSRYHCGGTLINNRYVITAAHCVHQQNIKHVRLGEWDLTSDRDCINDEICNDVPIDVDIEKVIVHPNYKMDNHVNDIALLRLAKQINFTDWISPICMPFSSKLRKYDFSNDILTIAGWGRTETRQKSPRKMKLKLPVQDFALCNARYKQANVTLTKKQMCAGGEPNKDSCSGDSGGPLMKLLDAKDSNANWYIVGITSYGPSTCATTGWAGIYTRVGSYIDWILSKVEQ